MVSGFTPETELERAFVQALPWKLTRLQRRASLGYERKHYAFVSALILCMSRQQALAGEYLLQKECTDCLITYIDSLDEKEKASLAKACALVMEELLERDEKLLPDSIPIQLVMRVAIKTVFAKQKCDLDLLDVLNRLQTIYGRPLTDGDLIDLEKMLLNLDAMNHELLEKLGKARELASMASAGQHGSNQITAAQAGKPSWQDQLNALYLNVSEARNAHGGISKQVAVALTRLLTFLFESGNFTTAAVELDELLLICKDMDVQLDTFELRAIYRLARQAETKVELLPAVVEELQRAVFLRYEQLIGYDVQLGFLLNRLVRLWQKTGQIQSGVDFCREVFARAAKRVGQDDYSLKQIAGAHKRLENLLSAEDYIKETISQLQARELNEPEEFVSALVLIGLRLVATGNQQIAPEVWQEALAFYSDCLGDSARIIGEMLWLMVFSELMNNQDGISKLIEVSSSKVCDDYLSRKLNEHIIRLFNTLIEDDSKSALFYVQYALSARQPELYSDLVCLLVLQAIAQEAQGEMEPMFATLRQLEQYLIGPYAIEAEARVKYTAWVAETLALHNDLDGAITLLNQLKAEPLQLSDDAYFRIARVGEICAAKGKLSGAKATLSILLSCTPSDVPGSNVASPVEPRKRSMLTRSSRQEASDAVLSQSVDLLIKAGLPEQAMDLLQERLKVKLPDDYNANVYRLKLARLKMQSDPFESSALMNEAISAIENPSERPPLAIETTAQPPLEPDSTTLLLETTATAPALATEASGELADLFSEAHRLRDLHRSHLEHYAQWEQRAAAAAQQNDNDGFASAKAHSECYRVMASAVEEELKELSRLARKRANPSLQRSNDIQSRLNEVRRELAILVSEEQRLRDLRRKHLTTRETWRNRSAMAAQQNSQDLVNSANEQIERYRILAVEAEADLVKLKEKFSLLKQRIRALEAELQGHGP